MTAEHTSLAFIFVLEAGRSLQTSRADALPDRPAFLLLQSQLASYNLLWRCALGRKVVLHLTNRREFDPGRNIMSMAIASELREIAVIEVSAKEPTIPNRRVTGTVHRNEKKILTVLTNEKIAASSTVRVQTKDLLTFGAVLGCIPEPDAKWTVYIGVKRRMFIV